MTLDQYLATEGITAAEFGARCNPPISEASISRIRRGEQNITLEVAQRIFMASEGKVTANDLLKMFAAPSRPTSSGGDEPRAPAEVA